MLQFLLIILLVLIVMLFLFSLKIYFMLVDFSTKLAEIDARVVKLEKLYHEVKVDVDKLKDNYKYLLQLLSGFKERK